MDSLADGGDGIAPVDAHFLEGIEVDNIGRRDLEEARRSALPPSVEGRVFQRDDSRRDLILGRGHGEGEISPAGPRRGE